jgi:hypothetical protein
MNLRMHILMVTYWRYRISIRVQRRSTYTRVDVASTRATLIHWPNGGLV